MRLKLVTKWQPIVTAPKDGTTVLFFQDCGNLGINIQAAYWDESQCEFGGKGWCYGLTYYPTHWMSTNDFEQLKPTWQANKASKLCDYLRLGIVVVGEVIKNFI
jgi:hypothetical protein